ncbi:hypothetical protein Nepgr_022853 [Nepenthes gracilis]|uniref:Uncharacterized protein n=1 Tax=Nepenthes gracilis TaxID=150966 RepID=A0AAD3T1Q6_NEPGR|nr:hypothetical protein Nepgr_022853 [Nepenthes gracilis]
MCLQGAFHEAESHADHKLRGSGWDLATPAGRNSWICEPVRVSPCWKSATACGWVDFFCSAVVEPYAAAVSVRLAWRWKVPDFSSASCCSGLCVWPLAAPRACSVCRLFVGDQGTSSHPAPNDHQQSGNIGPVESKETLPSPTLIGVAAPLSSLDASKEEEMNFCDGLVERSSFGNLMIPHPPLVRLVRLLMNHVTASVMGMSWSHLVARCLCRRSLMRMVPGGRPRPGFLMVLVASEVALGDSGIEHNLMVTGHDSGFGSVQIPNCPPLAHTDPNSLGSARLRAPLDACGHSDVPIPKGLLHHVDAGNSLPDNQATLPSQLDLANPLLGGLQATLVNPLSWKGCIISFDAAVGLGTFGFLTDCFPGALWKVADLCTEKLLWNISLVDVPRVHPCCGRQMDPALIGCIPGVLAPFYTTLVGAIIPAREGLLMRLMLMLCCLCLVLAVCC